MLYIDSYSDMASYVLKQEFTPPGPGNIYNYSSGEMSVVWALLKKSCAATTGCDYDKLPWKLLFDRLGMTRVAFEQDGAGVFVGSSYVHLSLLDMARIGHMYLRNGMWGNERILPENFVKITRTPNPSYLNDNTVVRSMLQDGVYGLTWWLNVPAKGFTEGSYPAWPADMYAALGHYGQLIFVVPSLDLVVVRTGSDLEYNSQINEFGRRALSCLELFQ